MGATKGPYSEEYPVGTLVQIASREELESFRQGWKYHHPITEEQIKFADLVTTVKEVSFYHGGDELYVLDGAPGIWHERCLKPVK